MTNHEFIKEHGYILKEIIDYADFRGYDLYNLDQEMLDQIIKDWYQASQRFHEKFNNLDFEQKRQILGI